jgi:hypothetical protein
MAHGDAAVGYDNVLSRAMSAAVEKMATVDRRIIEAIIRAVYNYDTLILKYGWIADELRALVSNEDEYRELDEMAYELIANGEVKNVRMIYYHPDNTDNSVVAVAPCTLSEEQWEELEDLAELYNYAGYEDPCAFKCDFVVKPDRPSLDVLLHSLIRAWCVMTYRDDNALAVYDALNAVYKLEKSFQKITGGV